MDPFVKFFPIGLILRGVFPGVFFVLSLWKTGALNDNVQHGSTSPFLSLFLPIAVFAGVTIYTVYRSILYPIVEWFLDSATAVRWRQRWPLISQSTAERLKTNWERQSRDARIERSQHLSTWADYLHLQNASAWCMVLGAIAGCIIRGKRLDTDWGLVGVTAILFFAGFVSDWRLRTVAEEEEENDETDDVAGAK